MSGEETTNSPWRSAAIWMSIFIAAFMLLNTWRSASDPAGFIAYFGLPGAAESDPAFVYVYASRAFFLAAVTIVLVWKRQFAALKYFAAVAIVMPLCDAFQVVQAEGFSAVVVRHLVVALYLALTAMLLHRREKNHG